MGHDKAISVVGGFEPPKEIFVARRHVILLTSYYHESVESRSLELFQTTSANLHNPHIDAVHLLLELHGDQTRPSLPQHDKLHVIPVSKQPTYAEMVRQANTFAGSIVIIQNTDIEWDNASTQHLQQLSPNVVYALSRHPDPQAKSDQKCSERQQCEDYNGSHDAFAFVSPLPGKLLETLQFRQNLWGAENRVIYELKSAGVLVLNPCKTIITTHHHCSRKRSTPKERMNREKGDRYGAFYKSGFVASAKQYLATDQLVKCQQIQDDSYSIPFVDKDPHAMLGKNMTKWVHNAQLHIENNRLWEALDCERLFMLPNIRPSEKEAGWRSGKSIQRLVKLQLLVHPALFSHTYNRTFREKMIRNITAQLPPR